MGNIHGHRKHRNSSHHNKPPSNSQPFKYGPPDQAPQVPSSTKFKPKTDMVSLPYGHVDSTLRALAGQAEGFGHRAIGGLHGSLYHVTTFAGHHHLLAFSFRPSICLYKIMCLCLWNSEFWHWDFVFLLGFKSWKRKSGLWLYVGLLGF